MGLGIAVVSREWCPLVFMSQSVNHPLSWSELQALAAPYQPDLVHGPTNPQAKLRLFNQPESAVRVTLYRDHHAWCPYCQKVWLWLEEKQIPYRITKVTMFCYGTKEAWYKQKVPSGMLPAVELDGQLITESDDILIALETAFGPLGWSMAEARVLPLRRLERLLFRAWCSWLCFRANPTQEERHKKLFLEVVQDVDATLAKTPGPYFLEDFSTADIVFIPYLERMNASLYYYKGYSVREENKNIGAWFDALETRATYRGTQSDFHTHAHDLPPQMGGCFANQELQTSAFQKRVDGGPWLGLPDANYPEPETSRLEALARVVKHHEKIINVNPAPQEIIDVALRSALTHLITGNSVTPPIGSAPGLRYLRDRVSVPRDMSIYAAKRLRESLELTAALVGTEQGPGIPIQHRRDQDPANFAQAS